MCGIAGWVAFGPDLRQYRETVAAMTAALAHRGPDDHGIWCDRRAAIGHCRLAVVDPVGGVQPMVERFAEGPVVLGYGGEVYNHRSLRDELRRRGHRFRSSGDTEVVLRAYLEWGDAFVSRLTGMFAVALWDGRRDRLLLARDRLGVKPLYYRVTDDGVLFGSEPKALLAHPLVRAVLDSDALRELAGLTCTPGYCLWRGMRALRPGHLLVVDRAGAVEHAYWGLTATGYDDDPRLAAATVRELLADIVVAHLDADVPVGLLLSGGLDSTALTALAAAHAPDHRPATFSLTLTSPSGEGAGHGEPDVDQPYVERVVAAVGSDHRTVPVDPVSAVAPAVRAATVTARDAPAGMVNLDGSLYLFLRDVRRHRTVVLSGEGADEVFGGYHWFHDPVAREAATFPWLAPPSSRGDPVAAAATGRAPLAAGFSAELDLWSYVDARYREALTEVPAGGTGGATERRLREIGYLHLTRLLPALLERKDRIGMAHGLEIRVPFCDHRLVEYVFGTPWSVRVADGREKSLLRMATADLLPEPVRRRRKSHYPSMLGRRYLAEVQRQARALVTEDSSDALRFFDGRWLRRSVTADPGDLDPTARGMLEWLLEAATWFRLYRPELP
ncbi:asparagine synthase (glutamine-hydrolysing) [Micromonospora haikouensis]|uniref:asparagine synthase (glutamine-hydrolyzing) n=1 Tax=Micromonospora haikouensis TaxID=686309 RepID=A0A1C4XGW0_9ACTN|nr:asparagine synthase (glutamine-hydrolyzing) [Micromonospora haikouensis]SCF07654.1 asparagine synthase (glutamine-hydrolysing) [Micromonospora haikouensis]